MISIAIDGPAGAGKSTLARAAARELGFLYADTGALYRATGLKFMRCGADPTDAAAVESLLKTTTVDLKFLDGLQRVLLDGADVTDEIRTPAASMMASRVSAQPAVRRFLLAMQRQLAVQHDILMDGRDIGTVVLPNATVKIFLTASAEARARRRYRELCDRGEQVSYEEVFRDMAARDYEDSHRAVAPLKAADDAVTVDTSECDLDQSLALILKVIRERIG